ncbi:hypothetical protein AQUCO_05300066v1 [Aquilegia coerulea]|uniref:Pentacotripeptide-repeat region of PRORP domain-containing protein n=1 Tax=Aquilegia coerulea TaxID=218851 RepID=A0A2G5CIB6_AQUCA|nr:hypothetical protein AQUCO_05300066v1 [Aquilegia coerulea]
MLLQTTSSSSSSSCSFQLKHLRLCSTSSYSKTQLAFKTTSSSSIVLLGKHRNKNNSIITNYKNGDFDRKPTPKWRSVFRRISLMENLELGSSSVLNQFEKEGKTLNRWELIRIVKELRRFRKFKLALEVYEWMNEQGDRYTLSSSDAAIHLDLICKVLGVQSAEEYFSRLPETLKDKCTYGSLLNTYVRARLKEKAESLLKEMSSKGYDTVPLPYNVMMTLYMKLKDYDKAISVVAQMMEKRIPLDTYTYNIWLTACGATGSTEKMEEVLELMKMDSTVDPNWATYSTVATIYTNLGQLSKAKSNLRMVEGKVTGRERIPFHYLLSQYGCIGEKEDVYRIWNTYKTSFPSIPNLGYHSMIASLLRLDDIEGAKKVYEEWVPLRSTYDPRICNLFIGWYVKKGLLEKAEDFVDQVLESGGKVNAYTWEVLANGHIQKRQIPEVLSCIKEATTAEGGETWRPNPIRASQFLSLCEEESDMASKKAFMELLTEAGCLKEEGYRSMISSNGKVDVGL